MHDVHFTIFFFFVRTAKSFRRGKLVLSTYIHIVYIAHTEMDRIEMSYIYTHSMFFFGVHLGASPVSFCCYILHVCVVGAWSRRFNVPVVRCGLCGCIHIFNVEYLSSARKRMRRAFSRALCMYVYWGKTTTGLDSVKTPFLSVWNGTDKCAGV